MTRLAVRVIPRLPATITGVAPINAVKSGRNIDISLDASTVTLETVTPATAQLLVYDGTGFVRMDVGDVSGVSYPTLTDKPAAIDAIDGLTPAADKLAYYDGATTAALTDLTATGRAIIGAADAPAARVAIGSPAVIHSHVSTDLTDFTEAVQDVMGTTIVAGSGISASYNDAGNILTITNTASAAAPVGVPSNLGLAASVAANALTITLTDSAGATPSGGSAVSIPFRSGTAATGTVTQRSVSAANTLVISSGSTMGASNATAFRIWVVAFDDAGTIRLGAINCLNGVNVFPLQQFAIASSTAEGGAGAADSAAVFYTGTAVTSRAYTVLGYLEWATGLTTAGTWNAGPTRIEPFRPGLKMPGDTVQIATHKFTTYSNTAATIPQDNTIPQNTEGAQFANLSMAFTSAANLYQAQSVGTYVVNAANYITAGIFRSDVADALDVGNEWIESANSSGVLTMERIGLCASTSALTWSVRAGSSSATLFVNGTGAAARFNGSAPVGITVREIQA